MIEFVVGIVVGFIVGFIIGRMWPRKPLTVIVYENSLILPPGVRAEMAGNDIAAGQAVYRKDDGKFYGTEL